MPDRDYVQDVLQISFSGVFDFDGLYKALVEWFKKHRYVFKEIDYKEFREEGSRNLQLVWEGKRKVTDYLKDVIEVNLKLSKYENVAVNNRKRVKGALSLRIAAYLEKDYEERWSKKAWLKFMREAYDKYVLGGRNKLVQDELVQEMNLLRNEIKAFLNLYKTGK